MEGRCRGRGFQRREVGRLETIVTRGGRMVGKLRMLCRGAQMSAPSLVVLQSGLAAGLEVVSWSSKIRSGTSSKGPAVCICRIYMVLDSIIIEARPCHVKVRNKLLAGTTAPQSDRAGALPGL